MKDTHFNLTGSQNGLIYGQAFLIGARVSRYL